MSLYGPCEVFLGDLKIADAVSVDFAPHPSNTAVSIIRSGGHAIGTCLSTEFTVTGDIIDLLFPREERARVECIVRSKVRWRRVPQPKHPRTEVWEMRRAGVVVGVMGRDDQDRIWSGSTVQGNGRPGMHQFFGHRRLVARRIMAYMLRKQDESDVFGHAKPRRVAKAMRRMGR